LSKPLVCIYRHRRITYPGAENGSATTMKSASLRSSTSSSLLDDPYADGNFTRALVPTARRTLADVRMQVAQEVAIRAITKAEVLDDGEYQVVREFTFESDVMPRWYSQSGCLAHLVQKRQWAFPQPSGFNNQTYAPPATILICCSCNWISFRFQCEFPDHLWIK